MAYSIWVALAESERIRSGAAGTRTVPSPLCTETGKLPVVAVAAGAHPFGRRGGYADRRQCQRRTAVAQTRRLIVPAPMRCRSPCLMAKSLLWSVGVMPGDRVTPATSSLPRRAWSLPTGQATWLAPSPGWRRDNSCGTAPGSHRTSLTSRFASSTLRRGGPMGKEAGAAGERVPAPGNDYFEREESRSYQPNGHPAGRGARRGGLIDGPDRRAGLDRGGDDFLGRLVRRR